MAKHLVYLAGPTVFFSDAMIRFQALKTLCERRGFIGVAPIDGEQELSGLPPKEMARAIRAANIAKIRDSRVVLANVTPFRGPGADDGTAWEMGFAEALGKLVVPYSEDADQPYCWQVSNMADLCGSGFEHFRRDDAGRLWDPHGLLVEDFGLASNLMLAAGLAKVCASPDEALLFAEARIRAEDAYRDDSYPPRKCHHCATEYQGPAVFCSLTCAEAAA